MNRRNFLRYALATGGVALIAPELLIPKRTYFLPPRGGWFPSTQWYAPPALYEWASQEIRASKLLNMDIVVWDWHAKRWLPPTSVPDQGWRLAATRESVEDAHDPKSITFWRRA